MRHLLIIYIFSGLLLVYNTPSVLGQEYPKRIISLGPVITKQIYLLGAEDKLVGCTIYCPKKAKAKSKVGTVIRINVEMVISLRPDMVFATSLTDMKAVKKIKSLGIRVKVFSAPRSFDELCADFLRLGRLIGKSQKAEEIIKTVKTSVVDIRKRVKFLSKPKVIVQIGAKPLWIAPKNSFINDFVEFAGAINIGPAKTGIYSREKVIKQNPDMIIIAGMGIIGKKEKKVWQNYDTLNAVKKDKIYLINADDLCSPTPLTFLSTLKKLVRIFHEEPSAK